MADTPDTPIDEGTVSELLESTGGDRGFLVELFATYLGEAPAQVAAMRRAASTGGAEDLVRAAHALKGASASIGALVLAERSRALEVAAGRGELHGAAQAIDAIEAELARVDAALRAY